MMIYFGIYFVKYLKTISDVLWAQNPSGNPEKNVGDQHSKLVE